MDVIFEGALSSTFAMRDVLKAVLAIDHQAHGILHIWSETQKLDGRLGIIAGTSIISVGLNDGVETGYAAVRRLLQASEGNFAYLETPGPRPTEYRATLCLSLEKLLLALPVLPESPAELFDEKSLLDKVFGADGNTPNGELPPVHEFIGEAYRKESLSSIFDPVSGSDRNYDRNAAQPLLTNLAMADAARKRLPAYVLNNTDESRPNRQNTGITDGFALPWYQGLGRDSLLSRGLLILIVLIFLLSIVATLFGSSAVNRQNSLTIQKGTAPRTQP